MSVNTHSDLYGHSLLIHTSCFFSFLFFSSFIPSSVVSVHSNSLDTVAVLKMYLCLLLPLLVELDDASKH